MNRDLTIGRTFIHNKTYYRFRTAQDLKLRSVPERFVTEKPAKKMIPLTWDVYPDLGEMESFGPLKVPSFERRIATLLYYTMGLLRYEVNSPRAFHRPFPSPRGLYASEIYLSLPQEIIGEAGIYRYNPLYHAVEKRRSFTGWQQIEAAIGISLTDAQGVLVLGIDFWRIAHVYDDFALNLATIEAGHALGQILLTAQRLSWDVSVHYTFIDQEILSLFGLNEAEEAPLAVIVLWPAGKKKIEPATKFFAPSLPPFTVHSRYSREMAQCKEMLEMVRASRLRRGDPFPLIEIEKGIFEGDKKRMDWVPFQVVGAEWHDPSWLEAVKRRSSGNDLGGMMAASTSLSFTQLSKMLLLLLGEKQWEWQVALKHVKIFVVANRVNNLRSGIYRVVREPDGLIPYRQGSMGELLQKLSIYSPQSWNAHSFPVSIFLAVDYQSVLERYGNRGFQMVQLWMGQISQHLSLSAAAMDFFLRPLKSFYEEEVEHAFGLLSTKDTIAYQLILGKNKTPYLSFDLGF